jgi:hypothetical protein
MSEAVAVSNVVEMWKEHVLICGLCANAKSVTDICPVGKSYMAASEPSSSRTSSERVLVERVVVEESRPRAVVEEVRPRPVLVEDPPPPRAMMQMDARIANQISEQVTARVVARASSGTAIAVPMEKTSKAISFSTAPGVTMQMPERDIEIYGEMQALIRDLAAVAQMLSLAVSVEDETRKVVKAAAGDREVNSKDVAMVVRSARARFGVGSNENLFQWFQNIAVRVLRMGDRLGNFMRVDDETRRISKNARTLGIEMQDIMERSMSEELILDEKTRALVKPMRFFAIDLQGEIERRVGTP